MSEKKRVLVLSSSFPRFEGDPAGNFILEQSLFLERSGFEVKVIVPPWSGEIDTRNSSKRVWNSNNPIGIIPFMGDPLGIIEKISYRAGIIENLLKNPLLISGIPFYLFSCVMEGLKYRDWCDLILTHWAVPMGLCGAVIRLLTGKPHINFIHGGDARFLQWVYGGHKIVSLLVKGTDIFCATSHHTKEIFCRLMTGSERPIIPCPMGVMSMDAKSEEVVEFKKGIGLDGRFVVLYLGRLERGKGVDILIRAVSNMDGVSLVIAGDGTIRRALETMASLNHIHAIFTGNIDHHTKSLLLNCSDVVVFPSNPTLPFHGEGLPVSMLESLASGRAVVASRVGGIPEVIEDMKNGILVEPSDIEGLKRSIEFLKDDPVRRLRISENARRKGSEFIWENSGGRLLSIISKVLYHN